MQGPEHRARRWRAAAVAAVLVVGGAATVATTGPVDQCPEPTSDATASAFYGSQEYDESIAWATDPSTGEVGGFTVSDAQVRVPSCVAAGGSTAAVSVSMDYARTGPGDISAVGAAMQVTDGEGRAWPVRDVSDYRGSPAEDGRPATPASLSLTVDLPIDVPSPVVLHLGGPDDDVLSLDPEQVPAPADRTTDGTTGSATDVSAGR